MATVEELKEVLKDHLEEKGVLNEVRSQLRAQIFNSLNDTPHEDKKNESMENILMNELIKEYLSFNNYNYTASVFETESGNFKEPLERDLIA